MLKNIFWINNESIKFGQGIWPNLGNLSTKGTLRVKNKSNIVRNDVSVYLINPLLLMRKTLESCGMRKWRTENKVILPGFWTCSCDLNSSSHPNFSYICWSPSVILGSWRMCGEEQLESQILASDRPGLAFWIKDWNILDSFLTSLIFSFLTSIMEKMPIS